MTDKKLSLAMFTLASCLILALLLPYQKPPFLLFYHDWLTFLGITLVLAVIGNENSISLRFPWLIVIPLGLCVMIGIHMLLGRITYTADGFLPLIYLFGAVIALILGATLSVQANGARRLCSTLAWVFLVTGLISTIFASLQLLGKENLLDPFIAQMPHEGLIRPFANLAQPNQLALVFCLAIAASWGLYQLDKLPAAPAILVSLFLIWGLALTQSRIGWVILPLFVLLNILWRKSSPLKSIPVIIPIAVTVSYFVLVTGLPYIDFGDGDGRLLLLSEHAKSTSVRPVLFKQAWLISLNHPWLGAGWFEFGPQQVMMDASFTPSAYSNHAHNIILNFAAELGWPVTLAVFSLLAYWFYRCCLRPVKNRAVTPEIGFATLFLSAVLVHSLVEYPLWYAYILIPTALLMGLVHQTQFNDQVVVLPKHSLLAVFMVMIMGLLIVSTDYRRVVTGHRALGWESMGLKADEGSTARPVWTLFPQFYDYFQFAKLRTNGGLTTEQAELIERTIKRFAYLNVIKRASVLYATNGHHAEAVQTIKVLRRLHHGYYPKTYHDWKAIAQKQPKKYARIFNQLPEPD